MANYNIIIRTKPTKPVSVIRLIVPVYVIIELLRIIPPPALIVNCPPTVILTSVSIVTVQIFFI